MRLNQFVIEQVERILQPTLSESGIKKFIISRFNHLIQKMNVDQSHAQENIFEELEKVQQILLKLGWIESPKLKIRPTFAEHSILRKEIKKWKNELPEDKVVHNGIVCTGSGKYLDWIDAHCQPEERGFIKNNLDLLLRHVEIQRDHCLTRFEPAIDENQRWCEKQDIAILFSHHARRSQDLRFLNAAFKLNDWDYQRFFVLSYPALSSHFLLAFAEQEFAAQELLQ
jgi:hypothetical protein